MTAHGQIESCKDTFKSLEFQQVSQSAILHHANAQLKINEHHHEYETNFDLPGPKVHCLRLHSLK